MIRSGRRPRIRRSSGRSPTQTLAQRRTNRRYLGLDDKETFLEREPLLLTQQDLHEFRAWERAPYRFREAKQILSCADPNHWAPWSCRRRSCPTCSGRYCRKYRQQVIDAMSEMERPILFLFEVQSFGLYFDLRETLDLLRDSFAKIYDRQLRTHVRRAIGTLEVPLSSDGKRWNAHFHMVLDVADDIDIAALQRRWDQLTGDRRSFCGIDGDVRCTEKLASYLTKRASWSPRPASLPPSILNVLFGALHGRRLITKRGYRKVGEDGISPGGDSPDEQASSVSLRGETLPTSRRAKRG